MDVDVFLIKQVSSSASSFSSILS